MAINVKVQVRKNSITGENIASANVVNLQQVDFQTFCEYLAQDSTVGISDVAAVMTQVEKKLPLLLGLGNKVQLSAEGMTVRPSVSGSLSQSALKAKLEAKKAAGDNDVDVDRELKPSDLTVDDLTASVSIDFSKKFKTAFSSSATLKRVQADKAEASSSSSSSSSEDSGNTDTSDGDDGAIE
jgi:hypothetical protein